jgi:hypothetical protein
VEELTVADEVLAEVTAVPSGIVWSTFVNVFTPTDTAPAEASVTTRLCVPDAGFTNWNNSILGLVFPASDALATEVSTTPL